MPDDKPKGRLTKLRITGCASVYQGVNKRGDDYSIFEITAVREGGEVVNEKLRSFEELPVSGELVELMVTPFDSDKHGRSYTLSRKNKGPGSSRKVEELGFFVSAIDERLKRVEAQVFSGQAPPEPMPPGQQGGVQKDPSGQSLDERFGDIPF